MTKYAIIVASALVLAGCSSERRGDYGQAGTSGNYGASQSSSDLSGQSTANSTGPAATQEQTAPSSSLQGSSTQAAPAEQGVGTAGGSISGTGTAGQFNQGQSSPNQGPMEQNQGATGPNANQFGTAGGSGDMMITQSVTNSLASAGIATQNIRVHTVNGRVILSGQVNSQAEKDRVENQIKEIPGVKSVIDQLRVQGGASTLQGNENQGAQGAPQGQGQTSPGTSTTPEPGRTGP